MEKETKGRRGRKLQGETVRDNIVTMRFNREELEILETVTKYQGTDKATVIRNLLEKEYKKIMRAKASQTNMFEDKQNLK